MNENLDEEQKYYETMHTIYLQFNVLSTILAT